MKNKYLTDVQKKRLADKLNKMDNFNVDEFMYLLNLILDDLYE
jgi:hypothetical protein